MKVTGTISQKNVKGTISQKGVRGSITQKSVEGSIVQSAFDWLVYWSTRYPSALLLTVDSSSQITLNWTNNGVLTASDSILIYESTDNVTFTLINTALFSASSYVRTGLSASTLYYYKIRYTRGGTYSAYCDVASATTESTYPAILDDGNTAAWFKFTEGVIMDGANRVSQWNDKTVNGRNLLQGTVDRQPLWSTNGLLFDGSNDFMKTAGFVFVRPEMVYIVFRQKTWANAKDIFDGNAWGGMECLQAGSSPNFTFYAGSSACANNLAINTFGILRALFNGAASFSRINENAQINGSLGNNNANAFTLACRGSGITSFSNIEVKEIILRRTADDSTVQTAIYNYLKTSNVI